MRLTGYPPQLIYVLACIVPGKFLDPETFRVPEPEELKTFARLENGNAVQGDGPENGIQQI